MNLRVTLVQTALDWEDPVANRARFGRLLEPLAGSTDLVVLPEMFTTGFSMAPERLAEAVGGPTTQWLLGQARRLDAAVCGSVMTVDAGRCVNRLLFATPDGRVARYDKRHLFRMGQEHEHYSAGEATVVVEFRGWRIAPLVCYDLRFPVWSRRRPGYEYDLLVYVANWPARRGYAWRQLLIARAIENQCCLAGVNRIGEDGNGIPHDGDSTLLDALGAPLLATGSAETVATATLDREALLQFREKFPAHHDADAFQLG